MQIGPQIVRSEDSGVDALSVEQTGFSYPPTSYSQELERRSCTSDQQPKARKIASEGETLDVGDQRPVSALGRVVLTTGPLMLSDLLALMLAGAAGLLALHLLRFQASEGFSFLLPLMLLPLVLVYGPWGLYPSIGMHPVVELRELTKLNTIAFIATLVACIATRASLSREIFFSVAWIATLPLMPSFRAMTRPNCSGHSWWGHPVLVVSSGNAIRKVIRMMLKESYSGLRPCALVDPVADHAGGIQGVPFLNRQSAINSFVRTQGIRHAIIALPEMPQTQVMEIIDRYRGQIPFLMVMSSSSDMPLLWGTSTDCAGMSGIGVRNDLMLAAPRLIKRFMDIMITSTVMVLGLPIFLTVALLVKLTSRGSIFYGQKRLGYKGQVFFVWKFRTMRCDSEDVLQKYLAANPLARDQWERDFKLKDDPRVTPIGRFLRKTSLDELPQLWNVLVGNMSLVGPRPIVQQEVERYGKVFQLYSDVKPGITGLWQVSGRNNTTYEERVRLDNYYVRNWSPWLDVHILARTVDTVIRRKGAY